MTGQIARRPIGSNGDTALWIIGTFGLKPCFGINNGWMALGDFTLLLGLNLDLYFLISEKFGNISFFKSEF
jgi:hypothetical protein